MSFITLDAYFTEETQEQIIYKRWNLAFRVHAQVYILVMFRILRSDYLSSCKRTSALLLSFDVYSILWGLTLQCILHYVGMAGGGTAYFYQGTRVLMIVDTNGRPTAPVGHVKIESRSILPLNRTVLNCIYSLRNSPPYKLLMQVVGCFLDALISEWNHSFIFIYISLNVTASVVSMVCCSLQKVYSNTKTNLFQGKSRVKGERLRA